MLRQNLLITLGELLSNELVMLGLSLRGRTEGFGLGLPVRAERAVTHDERAPLDTSLPELRRRTRDEHEPTHESSYIAYLSV